MTKHQVQWAAQFAVGAELVRRGYSAAFFLGNQPAYDLLCAGEKDFRVQVKGFAWNKPKSDTAKGNYVLISDLRTGNRNDLIIIVHVTKPPDQFEFYVATRGQLQDATPEISTNPKTGEPFKPFTAGIPYRSFEQFQNRWDLLLPPSSPASYDSTE